jgi:hypothetical protein
MAFVVIYCHTLPQCRVITAAVAFVLVTIVTHVYRTTRGTDIREFHIRHRSFFKVRRLLQIKQGLSKTTTKNWHLMRSGCKRRSVHSYFLQDFGLRCGNLPLLAPHAPVNNYCNSNSPLHIHCPRQSNICCKNNLIQRKFCGCSTCHAPCNDIFHMRQMIRRKRR